MLCEFVSVCKFVEMDFWWWFVTFYKQMHLAYLFMEIKIIMVIYNYMQHCVSIVIHPNVIID